MDQELMQRLQRSKNVRRAAGRDIGEPADSAEYEATSTGQQSRRKDPPYSPAGGGLTHAQGPHVAYEKKICL